MNKLNPEKFIPSDSELEKLLEQEQPDGQLKDKDLIDYVVNTVNKHLNRMNNGR